MNHYHQLIFTSYIQIYVPSVNRDIYSIKSTTTTGKAAAKQPAPVRIHNLMVATKRSHFPTLGVFFLIPKSHWNEMSGVYEVSNFGSFSLHFLRWVKSLSNLDSSAEILWVFFFHK